MLRRALLLAVAATLAAAAAASAQPRSSLCTAGCYAAPAGSGPLFLITGHGWGHGVGMSQYGAYGYAQHGWNYRQIVGHYYPGTTLGAAPVSRIRVLLADGKRALTIASPAPFKVRDGDGQMHDLAAGAFAFGPGLKLKVDDLPKPAPLTPPLTFLPGSAPLTLSRPYRGQILVDVVDGKLRAINDVPLEQYLYGVVPSEMPFDWAPEALKAQAVVARSYALATRKIGAPFDVYPDTRSQMYLGLDHERPTTNAAVDATAGQVVLYQGQVAKTYFYSTSGGRTASSADVWGGAVPYLVSVPDPYDTISPYHDWGPFPVTAAKLAALLHAPGRVSDLQTTTDSSGRVTTLTLVAAKGDAAVPAAKVRTLLGLRSTWFDVSMLSLSRAAATPTGPVTYGSSVQLAGIVRGLSGVSLEQRPAAASWQAVAPVAPAPDGTVQLTARPTVTTDYRLATTDAAAGSVRVAVAPLVRLDAPKAPTDLTGIARPIIAGAQVQIQRLGDDGKTWTTVAKGAVDSGGSFDVPLQLTPGTYRARVAPGHGYVAGVTQPLRVVG